MGFNLIKTFREILYLTPAFEQLIPVTKSIKIFNQIFFLFNDYLTTYIITSSYQESNFWIGLLETFL